MQEYFGYIVIALFVAGLLFSLWHHLRILKDSSKWKNTPSYKRILIGNILSTLAVAGFLGGFVYNIGISTGVIHASIFTGREANAACFLFAGVLIVSKVFITPRQKYSLPE
ncbi:hypothetical protein U0355_09650 [Salimicrobium sp. PL1-032A]|uniref:hypothetical protein n=1 Tax=Salimicrobium sp. PL1-032A TaxID=3095364 RepID=UPI003261350C